MSKKKVEDEAEPGCPAWMGTFGDLMNLLLCFFVLLFSMSSVDAEKFEMIVESFSQTFNIFQGGSAAIGEEVFITNGMEQLTDLDTYLNSLGKVTEGSSSVGSENTKDNDSDYEHESEHETTIEELREELEAEKLKESEKLAEAIQQELESQNIAELIDLTFNTQYVLLALNGALLFDSGSDKLKEEAKVTLEKVGTILEKYAESIIEVEGHTDDVPINSGYFTSNDVLSSFRALSVFDFFMEVTNLEPSIMKHSGRGEYVPIATNETAEGRALNRRVEIKIYHSLSSY
ncbi:MAG: flagellar motor protein MotB [Eubacteriales bacterium]